MFKVDPVAVIAAAESFEVSANCLAKAAQYHRAPSQLEFFDKGLIRRIEDSHQEFAGLLQARLDGAAAALKASAEELGRVATFYSQTDLAAAARVDATLPAVERADHSPWSGR
ncbi:hypothetical protein Rhe02_64120 [Rhizocola hellebori]|uniref:Uncharacterized protein n=1 Tax=Rhizocola hellebori TaxID=1392758 RepID=A0A8J3QEY3_9ACTN|nr:hypothetical protein [Rhizocola hellebori]GIH08345.1 hypothetical protein Rhe02_64120 [Rhizocola hellebori]